MATHFQRIAAQIAPHLLNLNSALDTLRAKTLARAGQIHNRSYNVHEFHGVIGGKNNSYADCVFGVFGSPQSFIATWLRGLNDRIETDTSQQNQRYGKVRYASSAHRIGLLLTDTMIMRYVEFFLERNFYRNYLARTREKPREQHWELWFGSNQFTYGLLITPVIRENNWCNDVSEIRHASFDYWTVGHLLSSGLIDPESSNPYKFKDADQIVQFYQSVLKKCSRSEYEKAIFDRYTQYLTFSERIEDEPLLIPEFRYAGREVDHKYRLDFTIFNSHVMEFTGFELSPGSTHGKISGIKTKTQKELNKEHQVWWSRECGKRNSYYNQYGIAVITYTDDDLQQLDDCFLTIRDSLSRRAKHNANLEVERARLQKLMQPIDKRVFAHSA